MSKLHKINAMTCIFLLVFAMMTIVFVYETETVKGATINVPVDYPTIQSAIENASAGDTIYVASGTYDENIYIDKSLSLYGTDFPNTIINGTIDNHVVRIYSDDVIISGFNITNAGSYDAGVYIRSNNCVISDNLIHGNYYGIYNYYNRINTTISNNTIIHNMHGIRLSGDEHVVIGNNLSQNTYYNINSHYSNNVLVINNTVSSSNSGFYLYQCSDWELQNNDFIDNQNSGLLLYYVDGLTAENCSFNNVNREIESYYGSDFKFFNSSLENKIWLRDLSEGWLINSTFDDTLLDITDESSLHVKWFLDILVEDTIGQPVDDCIVTIKDSDDDLVLSDKTNQYGEINNILPTEEIFYSSGSVVKTPHMMMAMKGSLANLTSANMNQSRDLTLVLDSPRPEVDFIQIEDEKAGGDIDGNKYLMHHEYGLVASGYNFSLGYLHPVEANWSSNDTSIASIVENDVSETTMDTGERGKVTISITNTTHTYSANIQVFAPVYNQDQDIYYNYIQPAINEANKDDRILLSNWTFEIDYSIYISKTINLTGESRDGAIIDGNYEPNNIFYIYARWVNITRLTIKNSRFSGSGIYLANGDYSNIYDNRITGNRHGIYTYSNQKDVKVHGNEMVKNRNRGIYFYRDCSGWDIYNNNISDNGGEGIYGYQYNHDMTIESNRISYNNNHGIYINRDSEDMIIKNNNISNNGGQGIYSYQYNHNMTIESNLISYNNNYGIYINRDSEDMIIKNNNISNNGGRGIYGYQYNHNMTIESNLISYNNNEGIYLYRYSEDIIIKNNNISFNNYDGIESGIENANWLIENNNISSNDGTGIRGYESNNFTIRDNIVTSNYRGIYADLSHGWLLEDNDISYNSREGIYSTDSDNWTLVGNMIGTNNRQGIYMSSNDDWMLHKNDVVDNTLDGIYMGNAYGHDICWNNISSNGGYAIVLLYSQETNICLNHFSNNRGSNDSYDPLTIQALDNTLNNTWNNSYAGNYWRDWAENNQTNDQDGDGIVDWPYPLNGGAGNKDHLPLKYSSGVLQTIPYHGSENVSIFQKINVIFKEPMDTSYTPTLEQTGGVDNGGWSFVGWDTTNIPDDTAIWSHVSFALDENITLNVSEYRNPEGEVGAEHSWNFTTEKTDTDPPVIVSYSPTGDNEPVSSVIKISFNESMNTSSVEDSFTIDDGSTTLDKNDGTFSWNPELTTVTFTPNNTFSLHTSYNVEVNGTDMNGNNISGGAFTWSFHTISAPPASQADPDNELGSLVIEKEFEIGYEATDDEGLKSITLYYRFDDGSWKPAFTEDISGTSASGYFTFNIDDHGSGDGFYEFYTLAKDIDENVEDKEALVEAETLVDSTPPEVLEVTPEDGDDKVNVDLEKIQIVFSESMDTTSVENSLTVTPNVEFTYEWDDDGKVLELILVENLTYETSYTVEIGTGAEDVNGLGLESEFAFTFITEAEKDTTAPLADAGPDRIIELGDTITFDGSNSEDNVGIVSYSWDFGDGEDGEGMIINHTYDQAGEYTVTLTVKDAAGNTDEDTAIITVEEEDPGELDSDGDGMPDWWEEEHGLDPNDPSDADEDLDGDGVSNLQEYLDGTDPTDPNDFVSDQDQDEVDSEGFPVMLLALAGILIAVVLAVVIFVIKKGRSKETPTSQEGYTEQPPPPPVGEEEISFEDEVTPQVETDEPEEL